MDEEKRQKTHCALGRTYLQKYSEEQIQEHIIEIVNQFDSGKSQVVEPKEKRMLAALNLRAGMKAKDVAAFSSASEYFNVGTSLLDEYAWEQDYELSMALYENLAICQQLLGNQEVANELFDKILTKAKTVNSKARIYILKTFLYSNMGNLPMALQAGKDALELYGIILPLNPKLPIILFEMIKAKIHLLFTSVDKIPPAAASPRRKYRNGE